MAAVAAHVQPAGAARGTFSALRNSNFRLYFFGQLVSQSGTWMQNIAQGYLVYSLTGSEAALGIIALAAGLPLVLISPFAGVVVERYPRRSILMATQFGQMMLAVTLTILAATGLVQVWHVVVLALILGVINAFDAPARQMIILETVGREDLPSGVTLGSILNSLTRVLGPTIGGIILARFGVVWCFALNAVSFLAVIGCLWFVSVPFAIPRSTGKAAPLRQIREGFAYTRRNPSVLSIMLMASVTGFFLLPVINMLPSIAEETVQSHSDGYALLSAAEGLGAVLAGVLTAYLTSRFSRSRIIPVSLFGMAALMCILGFQRGPVAAALVTMLTGLALITTMVNLNTSIQLQLSDEFRGRVMSLYMVMLMGLGPFGALVLGTIAELIGIANALAVFGIVAATLGGFIIFKLHPGTRNEHAQQAA